VANNTIDTALLRSIFLMFLIGLCHLLSAQTDTVQVVEAQSVQATVDFRIPGDEKIKEYGNDKRFQYKRIEKEPTWRDKITDWLRNLFTTVTESGVPGFVVLIAIVALVCLIVLKLAGVDFSTVFGKKKTDTSEIDMYTENVHNMDFDSLITNATNNKDYRLAVRFLYLKNLKLLTDKEIIAWKANKTNYSYQYEIESPAIRTRFMEMTLVFDYIWYGEFMPDKANYSLIYSRMESLSKMIADER
jgi:hypothetical protein